MPFLPRARRRFDDAPREDGFLLIEVVVALMILAALLMGVTAFFIRGSSTLTEMQRRQVASSLANQAMEIVRAVPPQAVTTAASPVLRGRTQANVEAQWSTALTQTPSLAGALTPMKKAWDTTAGAGAVESIPLATTPQVSGQRYTVRTFIGTCRRTLLAPTDCAEPATSLASDTTMYRAVIQVVWQSSPRHACATNACQLVITSLLDPASDLTFQVNSGVSTGAAPVARADNFTLPWGSDVSCANSTVPDWCYFSVKANDSGDLGPTPISLLALPIGTLRSGVATRTGATLTTTSPPTNGSWTYQPEPNWCGRDVATYRLTERLASARYQDAQLQLLTACPPPAPAASPLAVTLCQGVTTVQVRILTHTVVPGRWSMYSLSAARPSGFSGNVVASATAGSVTVTDGSVATGGTGRVNGTSSVPVTVTYPDGQTTTVTLQVTLSSSVSTGPGNGNGNGNGNGGSSC